MIKKLLLLRSFVISLLFLTGLNFFLPAYSQNLKNPTVGNTTTISTTVPTTIIANFAEDLNVPIPLDTTVHTGTLPNGMKYYIQHNVKPEHRVEMRLAVNAGSMQETDAQQGCAHFCEHMAFNGTKNFTHSQVVDFLESSGVKFGADLNAYTSFDETVYMLQLPTDSQALLIKGLQVLEDWSHNLLFDHTEIDKERGVVTEEWRLGQGANERMRRIYWPVLFDGSRYALRLPIGKMDVIKNVPYATLQQFYLDWYQPKNMAIVIVGDIDVAQMEAMIKSKFGVIPNTPNAPTIQKYPVPDNANLFVATATDKEAQYTQVQIAFRQSKSLKDSTLADYKNMMAFELLSGMFNDRLSDITKDANAPFAYAGGGYGSEVRTKQAFQLYAIAKDGKAGDALTTLLTECFRAKQFGFLQTELDRQKKSIMSDLENEYNEKDKTESRRLVGDYVYNFLEKEPAPGIEFKFNFYKKYLDAITLEEINDIAAKYISNDGKNTVIVITGPEKSSTSIPDTNAIRKIFADAQGIKLTSYSDNVTSTPIMSNITKSGTVTATTTTDAVGVTTWTLSNGARVILKPTTFKNDEIKMNAYAFGGTSLYTNKDFVSAQFAASIVDNSGVGNYDAKQLEKYLSDKQVQISPYISDVQEGMNGTTTVKDLETFMQLINLYFTAPRKDSTGFLVYKNQMDAFTKNRSTDPNGNFQDTVSYTMGNYNFRSRPVSEQMLNEINFSRAYQIYKERFSDASEFTFTFVGSFKNEEIKPLVEKYIATLPSSNKKENWKDAGVRPPSGIVTKTIYKGSEPKASVAIKFTGTFDFTRKNRNDMQMLMQLLNIKLRETLRENMSGTYGVGAYAMPNHFPISNYTITVSFGCAPENVEALTKAAMTVIDSVKIMGANAKDLLKIKELSSHTRDVQLKDNNFWVQFLSQNDANKENMLDILEYQKYLDALTGNEFKDLAKKYLNTNNYAKFILLPEKK